MGLDRRGSPGAGRPPDRTHSATGLSLEESAEAKPSRPYLSRKATKRVGKRDTVSPQYTKDRRVEDQDKG